MNKPFMSKEQVDDYVAELVKIKVIKPAKPRPFVPHDPMESELNTKATDIAEEFTAILFGPGLT